MNKKTITIIIVLVILVSSVAVWFFYYSQKAPTYKIIISPAELSPYVSQEQARTNVCNAMKGQLFDEVCRKKFDKVSKNDVEKIGALFSMLKKIENDGNISNYERLLLAQAVFAALPTKDSPLAQRSKFYAALSNFENFISQTNTVHAEETNNNSGVDEETLKKMMGKDLKEVVGDLPEGDNAWVVSVMVSRYKWINGERQPIYSEKHAESFDPYPGVSIEDKSGWEQRDLSHVRSIIGSSSTSQNSIDMINKEGVSERIAYSFSIMSWRSKPYGTDSVLVLSEAGPPEKHNTSRYSFTEENYDGNDLLSGLLDTIEMPSREQPDNNQKKDLPPSGTSIHSSEAIDIGGTPGCGGWVDDPLTGLYCFNSFEEIEALAGAAEGGDEFKLGVLDIVRSRPPTYPYSDAEPWEPPAEAPPSMINDFDIYAPTNQSQYPENGIVDIPEADFETNNYSPGNINTVPR